MNIYHSSFVLHSCQPATLEDVADKIHTLLIPYAIAWCSFKIDHLIRCSVYLMFKISSLCPREENIGQIVFDVLYKFNIRMRTLFREQTRYAHSMLLLPSVECNAIVAKPLGLTGICGRSQPRA